MPSAAGEAPLREELLKCARHLPNFEYPWHGLENHMERTGSGSLPLIGYGSLINEKSAARTIPVDGRAGRRPVRAYGAKRVFNYRIPADVLLERYGPPRDPRKIAALNCEVTHRADDVFNGVLTRIGPERLDALRLREKHYSLRPVVCHDWCASVAEFEIAFVLELLPDETIPDHPYDSTILPHPDYTRVCQDGAASISPDFLSFFNRTSWLADGERTLDQYLQELPEHA